MRSLSLPIVALALSVSCFADLAASMPEPLNFTQIQFTQIQTKRVVIGSLADISSGYDHGKSITVIHILELSTDVFPLDPPLLQVCLCGDQGRRLKAAVHTNITLIFELASHSRLTGCLSLISSDPWYDLSKWQTVVFPSTQLKRGLQLEKSIQSIVNGASSN
jgi:hypothetical protein